MSALKLGLYPRNRHNGRYDLATSCQVAPKPTQFLTLMLGGKQSTDLANPQVVKALNEALLTYFYTVKNWDIPGGFLCPPVPGHADYIHHLADLLDETSGTIPANMSVLDVGMRANYTYLLINTHEYGWRFMGSETSSEAFNSAQAIVNANSGLTRAIHLCRQKDVMVIFSGIIYRNGQHKAISCNPPSHGFATSARAGSERKRRDLRQDKDDVLNSGGQQQELWCEGGEVASIRKMVAESQAFGRQMMQLATLVSCGENSPLLYHALTGAGAVKAVKKEMVQG